MLVSIVEALVYAIFSQYRGLLFAHDQPLELLESLKGLQRKLQVFLFGVNTHTAIRIKEESRNTLTGLSYKRNTSKFYSAIRSGIPSQNQNLLVPQE